MIHIAEEVTGRSIRPLVLPYWLFAVGRRFNSQLAEVWELLPRYRGDNIFESTKFAQRFPEFRVTTYREGITRILGGDRVA